MIVEQGKAWVLQCDRCGRKAERKKGKLAVYSFRDKCLLPINLPEGWRRYKGEVHFCGQCDERELKVTPREFDTAVKTLRGLTDGPPQTRQA